MADPFDLDAYLARIGFDGDRAPTPGTLAAVVRGHAEAIPFENLDPLLGRPVRLDLGSLQAKLVAGRRGGYCFEQNLLLQAALEALGFRTTGLGARVVWNGPPEAVTPRTHMLLLVEGDTIVDVGFGGQTPTAPLALDADVIQPTPHGEYRLLQGAGGEYLQQVRLAGEWLSTYRFDLVPHYRPDYEVANHYTATHPDSGFTKTVSAASATPEGRWALAGRQLSFYGLDGTVERRVLRDGDDLGTVLDEHLGIEPPEGIDLDGLFERLPAPA